MPDRLDPGGQARHQRRGEADCVFQPRGADLDGRPVRFDDDEVLVAVAALLLEGPVAGVIVDGAGPALPPGVVLVPAVVEPVVADRERGRAYSGFCAGSFLISRSSVAASRCACSRSFRLSEAGSKALLRQVLDANRQNWFKYQRIAMFKDVDDTPERIANQFGKGLLGDDWVFVRLDGEPKDPVDASLRKSLEEDFSKDSKLISLGARTSPAMALERLLNGSLKE